MRTERVKISASQKIKKSFEGLEFFYQLIKRAGRLIFSLLILSCSQDPLKGIPSNLYEGALTPGKHNLSVFEGILHDKLARVFIHDRSDLTMEFTEGEKSEYSIQIELLYNLSDRYEIETDNTSFSDLPGAQWNFDSKKGQLTLTWTPERSFTKEKSYKFLSLPLLVKLKKRGVSSKQPFLTVRRNIKIIVYNSLDEPEILRISTPYNSYDRLDDGNFYTHFGARVQNLNHYAKVVLGDKIQNEVLKHFLFFSQNVFTRFNAKVYPARAGGTDPIWQWDSFFDVFQLYDRHGRPVPDHLLRFIQQPFYYETGERLTERDCPSDRAYSTDKESFCLDPLPSDHPLDFDKKVYVKLYKAPPSLDPKNLFYKSNSDLLCRVYHTISQQNSIKNKEEANQPPFCYLPLEKAYDIDEGLGESEDIYLLKEGNFTRLDKSTWPFDFYQFPESVKWQLSGLKPIEGNRLKIALSEYHLNHISFSIQEPNYLTDPPLLAPYQPEDDTAVWLSPVNVGNWKYKTAHFVKNKNKWEIAYQINVNNSLTNKDPLSFRNFLLSLQPVSQILSGEKASLDFHVIPRLQANYTKPFNPQTDVFFSSATQQKEGAKEWLSSSLSLFNQFRVEYVFPADFISQVKDFILPYSIGPHPLVSSSSVLDYLQIVKPAIPHSSYSCAQHSKGIVKKSYCDCAPLTEKKRENGQTVFESLCDFELSLFLNNEILNDLQKDLQEESQEEESKVIQTSQQSYPGTPETTTVPGLSDNRAFINQKQKKWQAPVSAYYMAYNYFLYSEEFFLKNAFHKNSSVKNIPLALDKTADFEEDPLVSNTNEAKGSQHIFINLQPELTCSSQAGKLSSCEILYRFKPIKKIHWGSVYAFNDIPNFFTEKGMDVRVSCNNGAEEQNDCPCQRPEFTDKGLSMKCLFEPGRSISVHLKTENPNIYFLHTDREHNEKPESYKSSPLVFFDIY